MTKRRKLKLILLMGIVIEAVLLTFAFAPVTVYSRELNSAYHRYVSSPSDATKEDYERTRERALGTLHLVKDSALLLALVNPVIVIIIVRKRKRDSNLAGEEVPYTN